MGNSIEILVVDDDVEIADLVEIYLCSADYVVHKAFNARDGLALLEKHDIKLAIIDIMMPVIDGIEMCRRIRQKKNIPIIMLSAKSADLDKIVGLSAGADDYMTKPFNPLELTARVKSQLRRYMELNPNVSKSADSLICIKDITIDVSRHKVTVGDRDVALTPIEFEILKLLASHPDRVFSTDEIFEKVWNEKIYEANNTVMVHIRRLREKIEYDPKSPQIILTVWGLDIKLKAKLHTSYRIKMMLYTILSMVITFCFDFAAIYAFNIFYRKRPQNRELSVIEANGSYVPPAENNMNNYPSIMPSKGGAEAFNYLGVLFYAVLIILSITIFLTVFLLLTRKTVLYLQEISGALEKISEGHFETRVPVRYNDEFSIIADNINCMTMDLEYLKKSEQAAEKKKNELITNVAHDLRTPLTSIIGYLDILNTHPELTEEKKKTYIQIAYNKAEKLKTLIEDLFSFTKLTYGQMPLKFSKIDLVKLLEQEIDEFYPYFTENHLVCELHTDTPAAPVMADSTLLARAFENLISNAIKYGKDGKIVYVDISHDETFVTAAIKNYGLVIPQKDLPLIFDKFYRVEHSREETLGGTGLGLSIAKAIVESHKGIITAQSSLEGTVFKVSLPLISKETNLKG